MLKVAIESALKRFNYWFRERCSVVAWEGAPGRCAPVTRQSPCHGAAYQRRRHCQNEWIIVDSHASGGDRDNGIPGGGDFRCHLGEDGGPRGGAFPGDEDPCHRLGFGDAMHRSGRRRRDSSRLAQWIRCHPSLLHRGHRPRNRHPFRIGRALLGTQGHAERAQDSGKKQDVRWSHGM